MSKKRNDSFEDDGRTIVDMSGIEPPNLFGFRPLPGRSKPAAPPAKEPEQDRPWEQPPTLSKKQERSYLFGALAAGLLIAAVFIILGAIVIALMTTFWRS